VIHGVAENARRCRVLRRTPDFQSRGALVETRAMSRLPARIVECGFFWPADAVQSEIRDAHGFLNVPAAGVGSPLQFFRVCVGSGGREFIVVDSRGGVDREVARMAAASRFGFAGCVLLVQDGEGHATVDHDLGAEKFEVAAAAAVIRYSAAWDESAVIIVADRDSKYDVTVMLEDGSLWLVVKLSPT
jgi:hypothetical protein